MDNKTRQELMRDIEDLRQATHETNCLLAGIGFILILTTGATAILLAYKIFGG